jgi:5-methylthioadenosine/S-adenosylhomocysteine deaminase
MMADTTLVDAIPGLLDALPETHRAHVMKMKAAPADAHLEACAAMAKNWSHDRQRARPALGPTIPLHCSDAFICGCRDLATEFELPVQMHLGESKVQALAGRARYGKTLTAHLDALGLLSSRFTGAHGVWLDEDDIRRLADNGSSIAHNPGSNLRLGSGIAPAFEMLNAGVSLGIGTDGSASSDNQNMFEAMRMAAFVSRVMTPEPDNWIGTWDALQLGTIGGAKVLGMGDLIGQITPGFKADLVFLDLANVNFVPLNDAPNQILNCEDSSAVESVMIDGVIVLHERRFTQFDYDVLRRKIQAAAERLSVQNAPAQERMEAMAQYVSSHCVGLSCQSYHVARRIDG